MKEDIKEDLLIRYVLKEANADERRHVDAWLQEHSDHVQRLEQTRFLLERSKRLAQSSPLTDEKAWERFKLKRAAEKPAQVKSLANYTRWLQVVAAILVIGAGSWMTWRFMHPKADQWITLNAYEKVVTDTLPDGSVIQLNKHAVVSYSGRTVKLKGEAFFNVVHDANNPFIVQINDVIIADIGTEFNIKSGTDGVEVIVESGIVKVTQKKQSTLLRQKQALLVKPGNTSLQPKENTDLLYQYYRTNEFVTDHTPLGRFVNVLNEVYGANIQIKGSLAGLTISGTYKKESLDKILKILMLTTPEIHRVDEGDKIILTR